jgi:uncharacterized protein YyaL (SSP411 family)
MATPSVTSKPNRLSGSTSPYLLQHAHNPVDWFPWGEEALEKAKREDKPIFLSVGYSSCHWCHVMERESFENEEIARLLNERFVPIKVDREERPDLDEVYMTSVQMMTGQGGWPLSVFLTPDLQPFFGGTYFPPEDRWGRPGFKSLLQRLDQTYRERRKELAESARQLAEQIAQGARPEGGEPPGRGWIEGALEGMRARFDDAYGGFGSAPKFPPAMGLLLLLRHLNRTRELAARHMVQTTLDHMAAGGLFDQLGGGFARYSTDREWLVPHFEKMLYDNALLVRAYLESWQALGRPLDARVVRETCDFVLREMAAPEGGFASALDADSEGEEGRFYVWTPAEVEGVLGAEEGAAFARLFDVTVEGNWEHGRSVLRLLPERAHRLADPVHAKERERVDGWRRRMLEARERRVRPGRDEKVLAAWNGMMIGGLARAGAVLGEPRYLEAAQKASAFLLERLRPVGTLMHSFNRGRAEVPGFLDDVALLGLGVLDLFESTGEVRWLESALALADEMDRRFWDDGEGLYFYSESAHATPIARTHGGEDGATPGGNSAAAHLLVRLARLTGREPLAARARRVMSAHSGLAARAPSALHFMLGAVADLLADPREIVVVGDPADPYTVELAAVAQRAYAPEAVRVIFDPGSPDARRLRELLPLIEGKSPAQPTAYVCSGYSCREPVTDAAAFERELDSRRPADS